MLFGKRFKGMAMPEKNIIIVANREATFRAVLTSLNNKEITAPNPLIEKLDIRMVSIKSGKFRLKFALNTPIAVKYKKKAVSRLIKSSDSAIPVMKEIGVIGVVRNLFKIPSFLYLANISIMENIPNEKSERAIIPGIIYPRFPFFTVPIVILCLFMEKRDIK